MFRQLLTGLIENAREGYINIVDAPTEGIERNGDIKLYNYTRKTVYNGHWNEYTCRARGLVLDLLNEKIVACTFPKFFNYQELDRYQGSFIPQVTDFQ